MDKYPLTLIQKNTLENIANSIRTKTGKTEPIDPARMAEEISGISGGGVNPKIIDGTLTVITAEDLVGVTTIRPYMFYYYHTLTSIIIPDSITSIGSGAFHACVNLTSVTIPDSITTIGNSAFYDCTRLTSVTIPDSVTSIGDSVFNNCAGLTSVTIGNSVTSIGNYVFEYCSGLTSVTIPDSVTSIGYDAFGYCTGLILVTIGNSVTNIGDYAFEGCTCLASVTIPDSVTSIGDYAFGDCTGLTDVIVEGDTVKTLVSSSTFGDTPIYDGTGYIYIKPSSTDVDEATLVEEYKKATNWSIYVDQIKPFSEYSIGEE